MTYRKLIELNDGKNITIYDTFSVKLTRKYLRNDDRVSPSKLCYRLIAPELCLLTLLPNQQLIQITNTIDKYSAFATKETESFTTNAEMKSEDGVSKIALKKEWMSRLLRSANQLGHLHDGMRRHLRRLEIFKPQQENWHEQHKSVEHLSLRAYPIRYLMPQRKGTSDNYVLVVAFHMTEEWFSAFVRHMQPVFQEQDIHHLNGIEPKMLPPKTWEELVDQLKQAIGHTTPSPSSIILHVPTESKLKEILANGPWEIKDDMPKEYSGPDRLVIRRMTSRKPRLTKMQLEPTIPKTLPNLSTLSEAKKDTLIRLLWDELKKVRES
jgi:hypothetical protein